MGKARKVGLPDFVKSKFDNHFVEELSARTRTPVIRNIPIDRLKARPVTSFCIPCKTKRESVE